MGAIAGGLTGVAVGVGVPIFFNAQSDKAEERPNVDNCFPCQATGSVPCRFCENGSGTITVTLGDGTTEETESELRGAGRHDLPHVQWVGAAAEVSRPPRVRRQRLRGLPLSAEEAPGSPTHRRGGGGGQPTLASLSLSLSRPTTPRHGMPRR